MANLLKKDDIVLWSPEIIENKWGDLVVFAKGERWVLHRIINNNRTKGDWLTRPDLIRFSQRKTKGTVLSILRGQTVIYKRGQKKTADLLSAFLSFIGWKLSVNYTRKSYKLFRFALVLTNRLFGASK